MIRISNKPKHLRYLGFSEYIVEHEILYELLSLIDKTDNDFFNVFYYGYHKTDLFIRNPKVELVMKLKFGDKVQEVNHFGKGKQKCGG